MMHVMIRLQPDITTTVAATCIEWRLVAVFEKRPPVISVAEGEMKDCCGIRDRTMFIDQMEYIKGTEKTNVVHISLSRDVYF